MNNSPPLPPEQSCPRESIKLSEDARELLGVGKDDWWCYIGWVLLAISCFLQHPVAVILLFVVSCVFVGIFLGKSYPRYLKTNTLSHAVRIYCLFGNIFVIALQIVVMSVKSWFLFIN
jgi:hypothetical protein